MDDRRPEEPRGGRPIAQPAIEVRDLHKRYGDVVAVDGIGFEVRPGEVFCLVGPNGAGKTTAIECMEGYRRPDEGTVRVLGLDPDREASALARRIGVQLQEASLPARLKVWEILKLFSVLYERPSVPWDLLDRLGLDAKRDAYFEKLSGGQKQRLFVALALINEPEVVFLDELTTGLDPEARRSIWELIRGIRKGGTTVVLSTHFMDEAEALADRVAILQSGRVVAIDEPASLVRSIEGDTEVRLHVEGRLQPGALEAVEGVTLVEGKPARTAEPADETASEVAGPAPPPLSADPDEWVVYGSGSGWIARLVAAVEAMGVDLIDLSTHRPSLEDVYLELTGAETYPPPGAEPGGEAAAGGDA